MSGRLSPVPDPSPDRDPETGAEVSDRWARRGRARQTPVLQSVAKALHVLELVGASPEGVAAKEVARSLDVSLPSAYHLLSTLVDTGYAVHLSGEARYGLGSKARFLGQALCRQLAVPREVADGIRQVHADADAAAYYAVYRDTRVVVAHVEDSERRPRVQPLDVGFDEAAHATAFGKVMLASMGDAERDGYLSALGCPPLTPSTITGRQALAAHLGHVRESGVALELEEFQPGLGCMAAAVRERSGAVVASVAVSLPVAELRQRRWHLEKAVRRGAARVTRALTRSG